MWCRAEFAGGGIWHQFGTVFFCSYCLMFLDWHTEGEHIVHIGRTKQRVGFCWCHAADCARDILPVGSWIIRSISSTPTVVRTMLFASIDEEEYHDWVCQMLWRGQLIPLLFFCWVYADRAVFESDRGCFLAPRRYLTWNRVDPAIIWQ